MASEIKKQSFESRIADLEAIVNHLQGGQLTLDDSIKEFKQGMELAQTLQKELDQAQATLAQLVDENGNFQPAEEVGDDLSNNGVQNQGYHSEFTKNEEN
ncbi:exodeoxyribonuclease VII small subunit [Lactobacillus sp. 3B(2020)]|uniref:exodeoxyribonuclease VII small subunit n=1 Tax=Lactobacillus sp. 3B(2020) TaxID=2695882 RepID=UPI0015DDA57A|nr:exodeoxyribonuclease VII small subunit [Lactobacillus sp. 3B(2020)]QLL70208.1 exodeoxyribonuclease VII small subunit [Lactobacillus sp. 3B(2020)]